MLLYLAWSPKTGAFSPIFFHVTCTLSLIYHQTSLCFRAILMSSHALDHVSIAKIAKMHFKCARILSTLQFHIRFPICGLPSETEILYASYLASKIASFRNRKKWSLSIVRRTWRQHWRVAPLVASRGKCHRLSQNRCMYYLVCNSLDFILTFMSPHIQISSEEKKRRQRRDHYSQSFFYLYL